jgi:hypothetical protein
MRESPTFQSDSRLLAITAMVPAFPAANELLPHGANRALTDVQYFRSAESPNITVRDVTSADELRSARGIINGLLISIVLWFVIIAAFVV